MTDANPDFISESMRPSGRQLARLWGVEDTPSIVTRSLKGAEVVISDLKVNTPNGRLSDLLPRDNAYMICLLLRDLPNNSYWEEGRELGRFDLKRGQISISDLRCSPSGLISQPIHTLLFNLPHAAIDSLADEVNCPRIEGLNFQPGVGQFDPTVMHLGLSLMPALATPGNVSRLFTDHVTLALAMHLAHKYGGMQITPKRTKGGLAPWQEKRAKEMLAGDLAGSTSLRDIATACRLSVSHFSRAFRKSTNATPHGWLLQARVESAKAMLREGKSSLSDIAHFCGFANQSHFTRVFVRHVGFSPGAWRKVVLK